MSLTAPSPTQLIAYEPIAGNEARHRQAQLPALGGDLFPRRSEEMISSPTLGWNMWNDTPITVRRPHRGPGRSSSTGRIHISPAWLPLTAGVVFLFVPTADTMAMAREAGMPALTTPTTHEHMGASAGVPATSPAAFEAFKELGSWLMADDGEIAAMVGIGRTTAYAWARDGHEPRPATARRIYEHRAVLDSVRRHLGEDGLRDWLLEGKPSRRDLLLVGELQRLDRDVHDLLFRRPSEGRADLAWVPEGSDVSVPPTVSREPLRPSGLRPYRSRAQ